LIEKDPELQDILKAVEQYRQQVKSEYLDRLSPALEQMAREGKYLFEGQWLTVEEIRALQKARRRRHRAILIELLLLFLVVVITVYGFYRALLFLLPR
jgi:hypothetical protein